MIHGMHPVLVLSWGVPENDICMLFNKPTRWKETISGDWEHIGHGRDGSARRRIDELLLESRTLVGYVFVTGAAVGNIRAAVLAVHTGLSQACLALFIVFSASCAELGIYFSLVMRLAVGTLLSQVPLRLGLFLLPRHGSRALLYAFVFALALHVGHVTLCALVSGGPPACPATPLSVQRADGWVRAGGHEDAVGVQLIQSGSVDEDFVAVWHALAPSERHGIGRVRHGILKSHEALLVGVLQLLLVQDGVHLHSEQDHRRTNITLGPRGARFSCLHFA